MLKKLAVLMLFLMLVGAWPFSCYLERIFSERNLHSLLREVAAENKAILSGGVMTNAGVMRSGPKGIGKSGIWWGDTPPPERQVAIKAGVLSGLYVSLADFKRLKAENAKLKGQINNLANGCRDCDWIRLKDGQHLSGTELENMQLKARIADLEEQNWSAAKRNVDLQIRITDLERWCDEPRDAHAVTNLKEKRK